MKVGEKLQNRKVEDLKDLIEKELEMLSVRKKHGLEQKEKVINLRKNQKRNTL